MIEIIWMMMVDIWLYEITFPSPLLPSPILPSPSSNPLPTSSLPYSSPTLSPRLPHPLPSITSPPPFPSTPPLLHDVCCVHLAWQELSKLQFELEYKESSFLDSQQTWAERFDRWDSFHSFHLLLIPDFLHKPLWFYFLFSLIIWAMQTFDNIYDHIIHFYNNVFLWFWTVMFDLTFLELWALGINFIN